MTTKMKTKAYFYSYNCLGECSIKEADDTYLWIGEPTYYIPGEGFSQDCVNDNENYQFIIDNVPAEVTKEANALTGLGER